MPQRFTKKITLSPEALFQEVGGEIVILDLKSEQYFGLNEVGARIWQLLAAHGDLQQAFDAVAKEFDVTPDQLEADINILIEELNNSGLISYCDDAKANQTAE